MGKIFAVVVVALAAAAHGQLIVPEAEGPYVAGQPLSATETLDYVPAKGKPVHEKDKFYRDSEGRTRDEVRLGEYPAWIYLADPVAKTFTYWREGTLDVKMERREWRKEAAADDFGTAVAGEAERQIEGFAAQRVTGGNLAGVRAQDRTVERWYSPELRLDLVRVVEQQDGGRSTYAFHDIVRGEPDAALFVPPATPTLLESPAPKSEPPPGVLRVGGGVAPPVVLFSPGPEFSKEARKKKISGNVLVYLQVDKTGAPTNVRLIRGVGYGLDEKAVEAVKKYKFKPAMEGGQPVTVEMNVSVNFQVFTKP